MCVLVCFRKRKAIGFNMDGLDQPTRASSIVLGNAQALALLLLMFLTLIFFNELNIEFVPNEHTLTRTQKEACVCEASC